MEIEIVLDAMGGDYAPGEVVKGAVAAAREHGIKVILVGKEGIIKEELAKHRTSNLPLTVVNASQVIDMGEPPAMAVRQKKDSSIVVGMNLLKGGEASAFVSAGNSGAVMAAALLILGRMEGIERPALGTVFPTPKGTTLFLDVGANADCKATFLVQFAYLGNAYMQRVFGIENPRIGLLSNGEEETKGNQLVREAHELLKVTDMNFIGNIEGKDIPKGLADVVVTDGFTGNVVVKVTEGVAETLFGLLRDALTSKPYFRLAALLLKPALSSVAKRLDYAEFGGAPLLGVNGNVIIAHGRSDARAIKNAIRAANQAVEQGTLEAMKAASGSV